MRLVLPVHNERTRSSATEVLHRICFGLFLAQWFIVWLRLLVPQKLFGPAYWPEATLLALGTLVALLSLARELPIQNVLLVAGIIPVVVSLAHKLAAVAGIPLAPKLPSSHFWILPMIWLVTLLVSRDVARLILAQWRRAPIHGLRLIGLTALIVALGEFGLEHFWSAQADLNGLGSPPISAFNAVWWAALAVVAQVLATPALIDKKPLLRPLNFSPLALWLMLNCLFLTSAWRANASLTVAAISIGNLVLIVLLRRSNRQRTNY